MGMNGTDLVLGLGLTTTAEHIISYNKSSSPSQTLALFGHTFDDPMKKLCSNDGGQPGDLYSAASSLSNVSVKRERDIIGSDDGRKKLRLTKAQSALLEESFKQHTTLNPKQKQDLARGLKLRPRQVEVWFQNRRARSKLKQTEVECELLKKCCDTLSDENRRLQKELKAHPLYITICPSCQRIQAR